MLNKYLVHLFSANFNSRYSEALYADAVRQASDDLLKDYHFHYAAAAKKEALDIFAVNDAWLAVFLYRLGRSIWLTNPADFLLNEIHVLLRRHCGMEIYFSVPIGEGFEVRHGLGSVIGSRCSIGRGFVIHHGCTVGHAVKFGNGPMIEDNVEMGTGSSVLGEIRVGAGATIAAHALVLHNVEAGAIVKGVH